MRKKLTGLVIAAALAVASLLLAQPAAQASVVHSTATPAIHTIEPQTIKPMITGTCWNGGTSTLPSCYGLDPQTQSNCSIGGQLILTKTWAGIGTIDLMYSQQCGANWALIENAAVGRHFYVENNNSQIQDYNVPAGGNWGYTNMVPGYNIPAEACIYDNGYYCVQQKGFTAN